MATAWVQLCCLLYTGALTSSGFRQRNPEIELEAPVNGASARNAELTRGAMSDVRSQHRAKANGSRHSFVLERRPTSNATLASTHIAKAMLIRATSLVALGGSLVNQSRQASGNTAVAVAFLLGVIVALGFFWCILMRFTLSSQSPLSDASHQDDAKEGARKQVLASSSSDRDSIARPQVPRLKGIGKLARGKSKMLRTDCYIPEISAEGVEADPLMSFALSTGSERAPYRQHALSRGSEICTFIDGASDASNSCGSRDVSSASEFDAKDMQSDSNQDSDVCESVREKSRLRTAGGHTRDADKLISPRANGELRSHFLRVHQRSEVKSTPDTFVRSAARLDTQVERSD